MERNARILLYDIETSPILGYTWGLWQQDVIHVKEDWQILSVAWKWYGEKKVYCVGQDDFSNYKPGINNDIEVVKTIHKLFDEADIVIAHNGNSFDQKKATARMMIHGMKPPAPYKQLDTKLIARRYAAFTSNKLKFLASDLQVSQKGESGGFETWLGCLAGSHKAWKQLKRYNKQDIPPLEDIYRHLLPWVTNHPNVGRIIEKEGVCPKCGSARLQRRGERITTVCKYQRFQCRDCGGWCSARKGESEKNGDIRPSFINYS